MRIGLERRSICTIRRGAHMHEVGIRFDAVVLVVAPTAELSQRARMLLLGVVRRDERAEAVDQFI